MRYSATAFRRRAVLLRGSKEDLHSKNLSKIHEKSDCVSVAPQTVRTYSEMGTWEAGPKNIVTSSPNSGTEHCPGVDEATKKSVESTTF